MNSGSWKRNKLSLLLLVVAPVLFYYDVALGRCVPVGDSVLQDFPYQLYLGRHLANGSFPLWAPEINFGHPFLAEIQTGSLYPLNYPASLLALLGGVRLWVWDLLIHWIMGGLLFYTFLKSTGRSSTGALFGALSLILGGAFVEHGGHGAYTRSLAWTGLILFGTHRLFARRDLRGIAWILIGVSLSFLAGSPPVTFMQVVLLLLYIPIARVATGKAEAADAADAAEAKFDFSLEGSPQSYDGRVIGGNVFRPGSAVFVAVLVALLSILLSAALLQFLATMPLVESSARSHWPEEMYFGFRSRWFSYLHLFYGNWFAYYPDPGYNEFRIYAGAATVFLAIRAVLSGWKKREVQLTLLVTLVGFFLANGENPIFLFVREFLPGFSSFRIPGRYLLFSAIGISMLAARGVDESIQNESSYRRGRLPPLVVSATLALLTVIIIVIPFHKNAIRLPLTMDSVRMTWDDLFLAIASLWAVFYPECCAIRRHPGLRPVVPFLLLFASVFLFNRRTAIYDPSPFDSEKVASVNYIRPFPANLQDSLKDNLALASGRWSAKGYLTLETYRAYRFKEALLGGAGSASLSLPGAGAFLPDPGPLYFTNRGVLLHDETAVLRKLASTRERCPLFIDETMQGTIGPNLALGVENSGKSKPVCLPLALPLFENHSFRVSVASIRQDGFVYLSQSWNRGWIAYLDGEKVPVYRANFNFMAVPVTANHRILEIHFDLFASLWNPFDL